MHFFSYQNSPIASRLMCGADSQSWMRSGRHTPPPARRPHTTAPSPPECVPRRCAVRAIIQPTEIPGQKRMLSSALPAIDMDMFHSRYRTQSPDALSHRLLGARARLRNHNNRRQHMFQPVNQRAVGCNSQSARVSHVGEQKLPSTRTR